jgi:hypothetical protein
LPPVNLAWIIPGTRLLFAVALRAEVKCAFGIVVACQVVRQIGTPFAELDSHRPPPGAFPTVSETRRVETPDSIVRG